MRFRGTSSQLIFEGSWRGADDSKLTFEGSWREVGASLRGFMTSDRFKGRLRGFLRPDRSSFSRVRRTRSISEFTFKGSWDLVGWEQVGSRLTFEGSSREVEDDEIQWRRNVTVPNYRLRNVTTHECNGAQT